MTSPSTMATTQQQVQEMLDVMEQQASELTTLQAENKRMRTAKEEEEEELVLAKAKVIVNERYHYKPKKPSRPMILSGLDDSDWALFKDLWTYYKETANISELPLIRMELRAACSEEVHKLLSQFVGPITLNDCTEDELLRLIKSVAVKSAHNEVHQVAFHSMVQHPGEPVSKFVARLKAKAVLCGFEVRCSSGHNPPFQISYAEHMVSQRLLAGLVNVDHQRKILLEAHTLPTLNDKVERLRMLEVKDESADVSKSPENPHQQFNLNFKKYETKLSNLRTHNALFNSVRKQSDVIKLSAGKEACIEELGELNKSCSSQVVQSRVAGENARQPSVISEASNSLRQMLSTLAQTAKSPIMEESSNPSEVTPVDGT